MLSQLLSRHEINDFPTLRFCCGASVANSIALVIHQLTRSGSYFASKRRDGGSRDLLFLERRAAPGGASVRPMIHLSLLIDAR